MNNNILTYLRIRELKEGPMISGNQIEILGKKYQADFIFHGPNQEEVYNSIRSNIIEKCIQGYNCSIFAYGQTGSGKTYTIQGTENVPGIVQRSLSFLHNYCDTLKLSFIEIYNENMIDLFDTSNIISIREDPSEGVKIDNLNIFCSSNLDDSLSFYEKGIANRKTANTMMNENSSRSHSIFTVYLEIKDKNLLKRSKLCFVDLAGSEKIRDNELERLKETCNINSSLLCLGKIVNKLSSNEKWHVSYRDSKLTFILKDSLGGNCKLAMIGNVNLDFPNETQGTLQFLKRSKMISNNPSINYDVSKSTMEELTQNLQRLEEENQDLKLEVQRLRAEKNNSVKNALIFMIKKIRTEADDIRTKFGNFRTQFYDTIDKYFDDNRRMILEISRNLESINDDRKENIGEFNIKKPRTDF